MKRFVQTTYRHTIALGMMLVCLPWGLHAQQLTEEVQTMSRGAYNSIAIELPAGTDEATAREVWLELLKNWKRKKVKVNKKSGEIFADDVFIPDMSENTVDVYAHFRPRGQRLWAVVWFNLGGAYLSSAMHPQAWPVAEQIMKRYHLMVQRALAQKALEELEAQAKELEKQLDKVARQRKKLEEAIEKARKVIEESERGIAESEKEKADIEAQKAALERAIEQARQQVEALEKQVEKLKR